MLDRDLAELYGIQTKRLKEQVKRKYGKPGLYGALEYAILRGF